MLSRSVANLGSSVASTVLALETTNDRSSVRPPDVVARFVTVYDWPATPPESQTVVRDAVFESFVAFSLPSLRRRADQEEVAIPLRAGHLMSNCA